MADYADDSLSLTPIRRPWREVASMTFAHLRREHEPFPAPPASAQLFVVDARSRNIVQAPTVELTATFGPEPPGLEHWRALSAELWFGGHACFIGIHLREVHQDCTQFEISLPGRVRDAVYDFDPDCREFSSDAKSDLVLLATGLAALFDCMGFALRSQATGRLFGPPAEVLLRDHVEVGNRWLGHADPLVIAAIDAQLVDDAKFEFDLDPGPMHYRQNGYDLYDILWPRA